VKEAFKGVNIEHPESGEFAAHASRILNGLDMAINLLDHPEALVEALHHLAHQHEVHPLLKKEHFKVTTTMPIISILYSYLFIYYFIDLLLLFHTILLL